MRSGLRHMPSIPGTCTVNQPIISHLASRRSSPFPVRKYFPACTRAAEKSRKSRKIQLLGTQGRDDTLSERIQLVDISAPDSREDLPYAKSLPILCIGFHRSTHRSIDQFLNYTSDCKIIPSGFCIVYAMVDSSEAFWWQQRIG